MGVADTGVIAHPPRTQVIVTNTIPVKPENQFQALTVLSVANLLGETIWRVYNAHSVQSMRAF